ncbi:MAG: 4-hydroxy-tetrahydrodipicolinate synthase [Yoonia sp.]|jgi:4-hydroxy-tetrahydrodipicolinate synthase
MPKKMQEILYLDNVAACDGGDEAQARDIFDAYMPLVRYEAQPGMGLAIRKHTLAQRGVITHESLLKPGAVLSAAAKAEVGALAVWPNERTKQLQSQA